MTEIEPVARQFYANKLQEEGYVIDGFEYFMPDNRIGRVELVTTGDWGECGCEADFDSVEIEEIDTSCPQNVIEAFHRHIWFSQHSLSNIFAFRITVAELDTYAIGISGIAGDGWDNSGHFIEIFDSSGNLLGSARIVEDKDIEWLDRILDGDDFHTPAPKWTGTANPPGDSYKHWSNEIAVRIEGERNVSRLVLFTPEDWD